MVSKEKLCLLRIDSKNRKVGCRVALINTKENVNAAFARVSIRNTKGPLMESTHFTKTEYFKSVTLYHGENNEMKTMV